ncbi:hypothetical protein BD770DRAFT_331598, partial [Pilaira anomala]
NLIKFNEAVIRKHSPYRFVVGFIDETHLAIARPSVDQEFDCNGHHIQHELWFQVKAHDKRMMDETEIDTIFKATIDRRRFGGKTYALYGDSAYVNSKKTTYPILKIINNKMTKLRIPVEWEFGHVSTLFKLFNTKSELRLILNSLGKTFLIANMFKKIDIFIRGGNQTNQYFDALPPTSEII